MFGLAAVVGTYAETHPAEAGATVSAPNVPGSPSFDAYAWEVGDDNADGVIDEDESGWDCTTMGNRVCGPLNVTDDTPGCYDADGELAAAWPCRLVVDMVPAPGLITDSGPGVWDVALLSAIKLGRELGVRVTAWGGDMVMVGDSPMSAHRALTGGIQWVARGR